MLISVSQGCFTERGSSSEQLRFGSDGSGFESCLPHPCCAFLSIRLLVMCAQVASVRIHYISMSSVQCLRSTERAPCAGHGPRPRSSQHFWCRRGWPCFCCCVVQEFGFFHRELRALTREKLFTPPVYTPWKLILPAGTHCGSSCKPVEVHRYSPYLCVSMSVHPSLSCILIPVVGLLSTTVELISLFSHGPYLE